MQKVTQMLSVGLIAMLVFFVGFWVGNSEGQNGIDTKKYDIRLEGIDRRFNEAITDIRAIGIALEEAISNSTRELNESIVRFGTGIEGLGEVASEVRSIGERAAGVSEDMERYLGGREDDTATESD